MGGHMVQTPAGAVVGQTATSRTEPRNHQPGASSQPAEEDRAAEPRERADGPEEPNCLRGQGPGWSPREGTSHKPHGFQDKLALKKGVKSGKSSEESKINSRSARPGGMQRIPGEVRPGQAETPRAHLTQLSPRGRPRRAGKSPGHSVGPGQRGACRPGVLSRPGCFLL